VRDLPRRELRELLAGYELEPSLRDVFVEGDFDRDVLARCAPDASSGHCGFAVYSIDSVNITNAQLADCGLTNGNKQRVIALARLLAATSSGNCYRCVVDRDLDHWFGPLEEARGLRWTHCASLEVYFYSEKRIRELLEVTCKCRIGDWREFLRSFEEVLLELYALRLADRALNWTLKWITFDRCLAPNGSRIAFDCDEYSNRLLAANNRVAARAEWCTQTASWRGRIAGDPTLAIRGHDFVDLLVWVVVKFRGQRELAKRAAMERLLVLLGDRIPELLVLIE
jgi:hypothetical protein